MPRVLMLSSVPLAAPWNGADKNMARTIVHHDDESHYLVQTSLDEPWPAGRVAPLREARVGPLPTTTQKLRVLELIRRHAHAVDLVHIVASLSRPTWLSGGLLRALRLASGKPIVHTAPSLGDLPLSSHTFFGDATVVVSAHSHRLLADHGLRNVSRVYPPLDAAQLQIPADAEALADELRLGPRAVLYPAHYGPHSGIGAAIRAFAALPAALSDAVLVLACRAHRHQDPAEEERRVWDEARAAGVADRVRIVGKVRSMAALIRACAVTALVPERLASKMDLPMVILESLALGRPAIVGDGAPISESLFGGGLKVPAGDAPALADALARLLADAPLREQLARQGRGLMLAQCDPARLSAHYRQIYRDLLDAQLKRARPQSA